MTEKSKWHRPNRRRLKDAVARRLGFTPNKSMQYELNPEQKKTYSEMEMYGIKRLFFDIETTPLIVYSWRIGYNLSLQYDNIIEHQKIICISYMWEDSDKVQRLNWDKSQCDKKMITKFLKIMQTADEVIGHNGDRYDIKKLRTRAIFHRIPMKSTFRTLDTLKKSKAGFSFPNNKLDSIAKYLGVGAKLKHEGFSMWVKCMKGDLEALNDMGTYCDMDIVVLADVFYVIQNYIKHNTHVGVNAGGLKHTCPNCGNEDVALRQNNFTALGTVKREMECNSCEYIYETSNSAWRNFMLMNSNNII